MKRIILLLISFISINLFAAKHNHFDENEVRYIKQNYEYEKEEISLCEKMRGLRIENIQEQNESEGWMESLVEELVENAIFGIISPEQNDQEMPEAQGGL